MAQKRISDLDITNYPLSSDFLVVDNNIVTKRTAVINLSSTFATATQFNNLSTSSWNNTYTTVRSNSAAWAVNTGDTNVNTLVQSTSSNWNNTYTTVRSNSAAWGNIGTGVANTLSGLPINVVQDATSHPDDNSLDNYIIVNHNGTIKGILLDTNINTVYTL
jgi:hypothetical protein